MQQLETLYKVYPMYRELFAKQLELLLNPARLVAGLTGSRAGKTTALAVFAVEALRNSPGSMGVYLARTDDSVRDIFVPIIKPLLKKYGIRAKITQDEIVFENGSKLLILGANHSHKIENFRGLKLLFAIVDECASFDQDILTYFIDEILVQRLSDLQGKLFLISTPAAHCSGLFYDVTQGLEKGWGVVQWSVFDNPHMKDQAEKDVQLYMLRKQCDRFNPKLRREYDGLWATDEDEFLCKRPTLQLPPSNYKLATWRTVLGVDFGFNDQTAFSIIGWERNNPRAYVLKTFGVTGIQVAKTKIGMVTFIGNVLNELKETYQPVRIVGDPAGASKIMMDEFLSKHKIYMEPAIKKDKAHYIEIMNDAIVNQMLVLHPNDTKELQIEMSKLVWNEEHTREREGMKCDHFDATLYAWREVIAYTEKMPKNTALTEEQKFFKIVEKQDRIDKYGGDDVAEIRDFVESNTTLFDFNNDDDDTF